MLDRAEELRTAISCLEVVCEAERLCWMIGITRQGRRECRVFERREDHKPGEKMFVVIELGATFCEVIGRTLGRIEASRPDAHRPGGGE